MRALVTGVGGFCGAHLVRRLRRESGVEIAGLGLGAQQPAQVCLDRYFQADVTNEAVLSAAVREFKPKLLFHLAGVSGHCATPAHIYDVNIRGTVHVLEAVRAASPDCAIVIAGSASEYGAVDASALPVGEHTPCRPIGPYGISKYAATFIALDYARRYQMRVSVVRAFNIIGPGVPENLLVGALIARAKQALLSTNPVVKIGDMDSKRDFVAVSDAVEAYVRIARSGIRGEIFNICSGRGYSTRYVATMLLANSPRPIALEFNPDLVPTSPVRIIYGSYKKASRAIGFRPSVSLKAALKDVWHSEMGPLGRGTREVDRSSKSGDPAKSLKA